MSIVNANLFFINLILREIRERKSNQIRFLRKTKGPNLNGHSIQDRLREQVFNWRNDDGVPPNGADVEIPANKSFPILASFGYGTLASFFFPFRWCSLIEDFMQMVPQVQSFPRGMRWCQFFNLSTPAFEGFLEAVLRKKILHGSLPKILNDILDHHLLLEQT